MGLLKPATNSSAFLKAGILGFGGSGKTRTATEIAVGLCHYTNTKKAAFFDTESGSDYIIPRFKDAGLELYTHKGRAFKDLCDFIREAEQSEITALIVDSVSHVWRELQDSYKKRVKRNNLYMQDWGILKGQWQEFTDLYLNSKLHIILLGRAGYEYEHEENEATGKKEMIKVGTKMKVEGEMAYEPSLLIEMEGLKQPNGKIINRAIILKDRADLMNGKTIDFPKFQDFLPVIQFLNIGGDHLGIDTKRNSEELFDSPDRSYEERKRKHSILLEQLQEILVLQGLDGSSAQAKKDRTELLIKYFGSSSKTFIEEKLSLADLTNGIDSIRKHFAPTPVPAPVPPPVEEPTPTALKEEPKFDPPTPPSDQTDHFQKLRQKYVKG